MNICPECENQTENKFCNNSCRASFYGKKRFLSSKNNYKVMESLALGKKVTHIALETSLSRARVYKIRQRAKELSLLT